MTKLFEGIRDKYFQDQLLLDLTEWSEGLIISDIRRLLSSPLQDIDLVVDIEVHVPSIHILGISVVWLLSLYLPIDL